MLLNTQETLAEHTAGCAQTVSYSDTPWLACIIHWLHVQVAA
jgi:hypothetical protein